MDIENEEEINTIRILQIILLLNNMIMKVIILL